MNWDQVRTYCRDQQQPLTPPKRRGLLWTAEDHVGVEEPPPPPPTGTWVDEAHGICDEVKHIINRAQITGWSAPNMQSQLGSISDYMDQLKGLFPKADAPPPPPKPPVTISKCRVGSYPGHDPAVDGYMGPRYGPHHGIELRAPRKGTATIYSSQTPLSTMSDDTRNLLQGWTCQAYDPTQTMYILVFMPQTLEVVKLNPRDPGVTISWAGVGHVLPAGVLNQIQVGVRTPVDEGMLLAVTWDTGIRFEQRGIKDARAAHGHFIAGRGGLSPNGDVSGLYAVKMFGWNEEDVEWAKMPGPSDYMSTDFQGRSRWCAGFPRDQWPSNIPIPPLPD